MKLNISVSASAASPWRKTANSNVTKAVRALAKEEKALAKLRTELETLLKAGDDAVYSKLESLLAGKRLQSIGGSANYKEIYALLSSAVGESEGKELSEQDTRALRKELTRVATAVSPRAQVDVLRNANGPYFTIDYFVGDVENSVHVECNLNKATVSFSSLRAVNGKYVETPWKDSALKGEVLRALGEVGLSVTVAKARPAR